MDKDRILSPEKNLPDELHPHQNISSGAPSLAERYNKSYLISLTLFTLIGYFVIYFSPIASIIILSVLPNKIISATSYVDVLFILSAIFIASVLGWISYSIYKVKIPLPSGRPLKSDEAYNLNDLINTMQIENRASKIHAVKITKNFEMKIIRTPINGFPLFFTNTLLIGLPLMQSLSQDQFKVALLLQLSHIQGRLKRPGSWFYFTRSTWSFYKSAYATTWKLPGSIFRLFFSFYEPVYTYFSQCAARNESLYADTYALTSIKKTTLVDMMSVSGISQYYLESNFWPHLYSKAYKHKTPPYLPFASIEHNIQSRINNEISQSWIDQSLITMDKRTDQASLRQRLANLDLQRISPPAPVMSSAASFYLSDVLDTIYHQFDKVWLMTHQFDWQKKYQKGLAEQQEITSLEQQIHNGSISDIHAWEYILLVKKYISEHDQINLFKKLLTINTHDARIRFDIGRTLLNHLDPEGVQALEQSTHLDSAYTINAFQLITKFYVATGNTKLAQAYRRKSLAYQVEAA